MCAAAALVLGSVAPCSAQQAATGAPADTRCEAVTLQKPVPANSHAIDSGEYPLLALANGEAGRVIVDFRINADGSVDDVKVARSSGYAELDGAAVDAVSGHWRYQPVIVGGHPVSCRYMAAVQWMQSLNPALLAGQGYAVEQMQRSKLPSDPVSPQSIEPITGMMLTVGNDGRVLEERLAHASGYPDLDRAALAAAKNGQWHIVPASLDGKPLKSGVGLLVIWTR